MGRPTGCKNYNPILDGSIVGATVGLLFFFLSDPEVNTFFVGSYFAIKGVV